MYATDMTLRHRSWAFRALSRCGCALHQLLRGQHRKNPYQLFRILVGEVGKIISLPGCMRDELAASFFQQYPTQIEASSPEGLATLECMALSIDCDISAMESRHAITRRFTVLRSLQTWTASLEDINVQWVMKQASSISAPPWKNEETTDIGKCARAPKKAKHRHGPGGRGGGGGAWRAFLHVTHAGRKMTKASLKQASSESLVLSSSVLPFALLFEVLIVTVSTTTDKH